jgi:formyltetrahydrofolate deformylase
MNQDRYILTLTCNDTVGIVAAVTSFLSDRGLSIEESAQFHEEDGNTFFMRCEFSKPTPGSASLHELEAGFAPIGRRFEMKWKFHDRCEKPRIVVAVSKIGHCLYDLLHRQETGWLKADIAAVISNHPDLKSVCDWRGIPYHHVPITPDTKAESEKRIFDILEDTKAELLVLARYMQVLSPEASARLAGRAINIHHSFLPGFKGANPYKQAHDRGVKQIGATAHYVTDDLDEGPIIEQAVARVGHQHRPKELMEVGRDLECQVLARAVRWHLERRVAISGNKTVVFNS